MGQHSTPEEASGNEIAEQTPSGRALEAATVRTGQHSTLKEASGNEVAEQTPSGPALEAATVRTGQHSTPKEASGNEIADVSAQIRRSAVARVDTTQFDRSIEDLTGALGDPTRRGIYIAVRESPDPMTSSAIAKAFDIHPNVARHHLDRLAQDGYLEVTTRRAEGRTGPGAGRPAKHYTATTKQIDVHYPARRMDLLTDLLLQVIGRLDPTAAATVAYDVGFEYGNQLATEVGLPTDEGFAHAVRAVARAMTGIGFNMRADTDANQLLTSHCPFGDIAVNHPDVVCSLDQGLVSGLLGSIDRTWEPVVIPHQATGEVCVTEVGT